MGPDGALALPITTGWYVQGEQTDMARRMHDAVRESTAAWAAALAGAALQAQRVGSHLRGRLALSELGYDVLRTMLCQVAAHQQEHPAVTAGAPRLLTEGFTGSPGELIAEAAAPEPEPPIA